MKAIGDILTRRATRPMAVFLVVYLFLFLNVVLPGHVRGAVTLDGKHAPCCCCCCGGGPQRATGHGPAVPSQRDRDHCALCNFAARVTPPEIFDLRLPPLLFLRRLTQPHPTVVVSVERIATYQGRGPPPVGT